MVGRIGNVRVAIDAKNGRLLGGGKSALLKEIRFYDGKKLRKKAYPDNPGKLVLNVMFPIGFGVLADTETADTLLTRLFFELRTDQRFFQPVAMEQPYYSIWQVTGEKYED